MNQDIAKAHNFLRAEVRRQIREVAAFAPLRDVVWIERKRPSRRDLVSMIRNETREAYLSFCTTSAAYRCRGSALAHSGRPIRLRFAVAHDYSHTPENRAWLGWIVAHELAHFVFDTRGHSQRFINGLFTAARTAFPGIDVQPAKHTARGQYKNRAYACDNAAYRLLVAAGWDGPEAPVLPPVANEQPYALFAALL